MILCCGEALIDMLPGTTADGRPAFVPCPGGASFNTAIALGRLGAPAGILAGLSTDLFGPMLEAALTASGVETGLAVRSTRPTTLAFVTLSDGQARYTFHDENTAGRLLSSTDLPALPASVGALVLGGISLAVEPCAAAFEALATGAAGDRVIVLDPNIRPNLAADAGLYRARLERMIALADIVKVSDEDLDWILPGDGPSADKARALLQRGPRLVLVTEGARGATAHDAAGAVSCPARPVAVIDTVGAGDTFNAGVLTALQSGGLLSRRALATGLPREKIAAALALGVRASAATIARAGADPPWASELEAR